MRRLTVAAVISLVSACVGCSPVSQNGARITNYETPGNLAPTRDIGCAAAGQVPNTAIPVDLYRGARRCVDGGDFERAVTLWGLGGVYGRFDSLRVADRTAHQGVVVAQQAALADLSEAQQETLRAAQLRVLNDPARTLAVCAEAQKLGPPDYYPAYMIQHGMGAFVGSGGSALVSGFDAAKAWEQSWKSYLLCEEAAAEAAEGAARGPSVAEIDLSVGCGTSPGGTQATLKKGDVSLAADLIYGLTRSNKTKVCRALLAGGNPNLPVAIRNDPGIAGIGGQDWTPTAIEVAVGHRVRDPWFVETLLLRGADPNVDRSTHTNLGESVFMTMFLSQNERYLGLLVDHGFKVNRLLGTGETPLDVAVGMRHFKLAGQLLDLGARVEDCREGGRQLIKVLCEDRCLNATAWAEREAVAKILRGRGHQFQCPWEGHSECQPRPPRG